MGGQIDFKIGPHRFAEKSPKGESGNRIKRNKHHRTDHDEGRHVEEKWHQFKRHNQPEADADTPNKRDQFLEQGRPGLRTEKHCSDEARQG